MPDLDPFFFNINTGSFTRHRVWNRCQRQYYYPYIAPYVKTGAVISPEKIRYLKNFTSRFVVQGQLIHDIIDQQIQFALEEFRESELENVHRVCNFTFLQNES